MERQPERERLLAQIEQEVRLTRDLIGRDRLDPRVREAMLQVPRHLFVPEYLRGDAYLDAPLPIGHGQTISQPYIVALMTDLLQLPAHAMVLEVGTGSGYQSAVLSRIAERVYSLELTVPLAEAAAERLRELGYGNVEVKVGDGYLGWPEHGPYDGIIVTAAADHTPAALVAQLKPGAKLVLPVGRGFSGQELLVVTKEGPESARTQQVLPVSFVPLRHSEGSAD